MPGKPDQQSSDCGRKTVLTRCMTDTRYPGDNDGSIDTRIKAEWVRLKCKAIDGGDGKVGDQSHGGTFWVGLGE